MKMRSEALDCRGRYFDNVIIYYGVTKRSDIDDYEFRNHIFKTRVDSSLPKGGIYCTGEELFNDIGTKNACALNINFRNVQYVKIKRKTRGTEYSCIAWIFCLNIYNLYSFSFIGNNISRGIFNKLLESNSCKKGFEYYPVSKQIQFGEPQKMMEVWYNPNTLYLCVGKFKFENGMFRIYDCHINYRLFEQDIIMRTHCTSIIFKKGRFFNIPLTNSYDSRSAFNWTSIEELDMNISNSDNSGHINAISNQEIVRSLITTGGIDAYNDMLKIMFNADKDNLFYLEDAKSAV